MSKSKWIILGAVGVILVAGAVAGTMWFFSDDEPAPKILSEEEIGDEEAMQTARFMASEGFAKLPDDQQQRYLDVVITNHEKRAELFGLRNQLSEAEQKQLGKNMRPVFEKRLKRHVDEYNELPLDEREGYLDNLIDMMQEMRDKTPPPSGGRDRQAHARRGGSSGRGKAGRARMKKWVETTSPRDRAKMMNFAMGMMARLRARGINTGPR
ncbi:MAG: hypothetical protein KAR11_04330 [Phycisphaerae bacterium]|nr:hypothetical protein [Phycisphaerae bacterium]